MKLMRIELNTVSEKSITQTNKHNYAGSNSDANPSHEEFSKHLYCIVLMLAGKTLANLVIVHQFPTKFFHPNIVNTLKCNGKLAQFANVLSSKYTNRVISPKFHPTNVLRNTVFPHCYQYISYTLVVLLTLNA